jgi:hypothetical protein
MEEHKLKVFENRVLRRLFGRKKEEKERENGETCKMKTPCKILGRSNQGGRDKWVM